MYKTSGVLITILFGFVCIEGLAIESRSSGVNEEIFSKYVCNGKQDGVRIMIPGTCTRYFECKSGKSIAKTCASPNKFFDSPSGNCVPTSSCIEPKGDCSTSKPKPTPPCNNKTTGAPTTPKPSKTTKPTKPTPSKPTEPPTSEKTTPHDTPCETKRKNQQQKLQEELEQQYAEFFGASGGKNCDSPGGSCYGVPNGTLIPHKSNCNAYLTCFNGCGAEFACPASLHFNKKSLLCDKPENAKCDF